MELFLFARFCAQSGKSETLQEAIRQVSLTTSKEPGCLDFQVFRSVRNTNEFFIHSRWQNQAAFDLHASLPHTIEFISIVEKLIDHPFAVSLTIPIELTHD